MKTKQVWMTCKLWLMTVTKETIVHCVLLKTCSTEMDQIFFLNQVCAGRNQKVKFLENSLKVALHYDET
jgi:hypothetical protein